MTQSLSDALLISAIGMGLVFGAIALLWGVMVLLLRLFPERETTAPKAESETLAVESSRREQDAETAKRAAVAALAVALALEQERRDRSKALARTRDQRVPVAGTVTGWQAVTRGNQITHRRPVR